MYYRTHWSPTQSMEIDAKFFDLLCVQKGKVNGRN